MYATEAKFRGRAEQYENDVKDWLAQYKDLYPNYTSESNKIIMPPDISNNFDSGVMVI